MRKPATTPPSLRIKASSLFKSVTRHDLPAASLVGDLELPVLVGESALLLETLHERTALLRWEACRGARTVVLEHSGAARATLGARGEAVFVLLDGPAQRSFAPLAGTIVLVTAEGRRVELARKAADDPCAGGDGLGSKHVWADFDARGRVAVALPDRVAVFAPDGTPVAERSSPTSLLGSFVGWNGGAVVCERRSDAGLEYEAWSPDSGELRTLKRPAWNHRSAGGASRRCADGGRGPWLLRGSRLLAWRAPDGTSHRFSLPAAYAFWQWFAGDHLLCFGNGPPLVVDARTGEGQYCFSPDSEIDVIAASPTTMKLLASHEGLVAVADAANVA